MKDHQQYEELIEGMFQQEYGMVAQFIDKPLTDGLRNNLLANLNTGKMHPAGIGRKFSHAQNLKVRGDRICWIEKDSSDKFEKQFNDRINDFIKYLNRTCYTGITDFECHYAYYEEGSFYKRHHDQFKSDFGRKFSMVTYLNEVWEEADDGRLILYLDKEEVAILPTGGTSVCFKSDVVEHEVKPSHRNRMSIAGWLKCV